MEFWLTNSLRQESPAYLAEREMRERTGHPCLPLEPSSPPIRDLMIRQQQRKWKPRWKIWNLFARIPSRPVTWSMEVKLELTRGDRVRVQREIKKIYRLVVPFSSQLKNLTISCRSWSRTAEKCTIVFLLTGTYSVSDVSVAVAILVS